MLPSKEELDAELRERPLRARIAKLETALRQWRDHNECSPTPDGVYIMVPARQIVELIGEKPTKA